MKPEELLALAAPRWARARQEHERARLEARTFLTGEDLAVELARIDSVLAEARVRWDAARVALEAARDAGLLRQQRNGVPRREPWPRMKSRRAHQPRRRE